MVLRRLKNCDDTVTMMGYYDETIFLPYVKATAKQRHRKGGLQRSVNDMLIISRSTYSINTGCNSTPCCPKEACGPTHYTIVNLPSLISHHRLAQTKPSPNPDRPSTSEIAVPHTPKA
jgi:hypothetical protein